ncbi:hypothetical protein AB0D78_39360 [Streptomyces avermitilis]|uniref:hypothetical protein n=1 Tax=Streptomyces avermitilis TaxID=33903 RepID=UPI00340CDB9F
MLTHAMWLAQQSDPIVGAVTGQEALVHMVLLRNEFVVRGVPTAPDDVLVEIVDEVYLPMIRGRGAPPA